MQYKMRQLLQDVTEMTSSNRGVQSILVEYKDGTSVYLNPGVVHIQNGSREYICELKSQTVFNITDRTSSTWYAIYVNSSTDQLDVNDFHYSSTMPIKDLNKTGYYHPTTAGQRCIGFIGTFSDSNIIPFKIRGGEFEFNGYSNEFIAGTVYGSTFTDITVTPALPLAGVVSCLAMYTGTDANMYVRPMQSSNIGQINDARGSYVPFNIELDANKRFQFRIHAGTTSLFLQFRGFVLPEMIYTGAAGGVTVPAVVPLADPSLLGHQSGMEVEYVDSTRFRVRNGQIHLAQGSADGVFILEQDAVKEVGVLNASTQYAVYATPPVSGSSLSEGNIVYSTSMPVEDRGSGGWYHSTNIGWRCIGFIKTDDSSNLISFTTSNGIQQFSDYLKMWEIEGLQPSTTWTTITSSAPLGNLLTIYFVMGVRNSGYGQILCRKKGDTREGKFISEVSDVAQRGTSSIVSIPINIDKQFEFKYHVATTNSIYGSLNGFYLPKGIGSSGSTSISKVTTSRVEQVNSTRIRGVQSLMLEYRDTTSIYVNPGVIHFWQGISEVWNVVSDQLVVNITDVTASNYYAVYASPNTSGYLTSSDIHQTRTMPTRSISRNGWYHPSNSDQRCIGVLYISATSKILYFNQHGNDLLLLGDATNNVTAGDLWSNGGSGYTITTTPQSITLKCPSFVKQTYVRYICSGNSTYDTQYRPTGLTTAGARFFQGDGLQESVVAVIVNNSQIDVYNSPNGANITLYISVTGFVLPDMMYTGQAMGSLVNDSQVIPLADPSLLGFQSGMEVEYVDSSTFKVRNGQLHLNTGATDAVYVLENDITKVVSGLVANTQYAIYAKPNLDSNVLGSEHIEYLSTMPVESRTSCGQYHPTNVGYRCIGFLRSNATSSILQFKENRGLYVITPHIESLPYGVNNCNTSVDVTCNIPIQQAQAYLGIGFQRGTTDGACYITTKGGTNKYYVGWVSAATDNIMPVILFPTDEYKRITLSSDYVTHSSVNTFGFQYPTGIGSSGSTAISKTTITKTESAQSTKIRGVQSVSVEYRDSSSVYVNPGVIHFWQGARETWCKVSEQLVLNVSSLTSNTQYAIYASPNSSVVLTINDIHYSSTMPVKNVLKNGYQHPGNSEQRCIGFIKSNSIGGVQEFSQSRGQQIFNDSTFAGPYTPSNVWTEFATDIPIGSVVAKFNVLGTSGTGGNLFVRPKGSSGNGILTAYGALGSYNITESFTDSNKKIEFKFETSGTSQVYIVPMGFGIPDSIYTGQLVGNISDDSNSYSIPLVDPSLLGFQSGMEVEYVDSTSFRVRNGQIHLAQGNSDAIYVLNSDVTKTVSGLGANTQYAVYTKPIIDSINLGLSEIEYSSVMPVEDRLSGGWYNPVKIGWRCIGVFYSDDSSRIAEFMISRDGVWSFQSKRIDVLYGQNLTTTQYDVTVPIPFGSTMANIIMASSGPLAYRANGSNDSAGIGCGGYTTSDTPISRVPVDINKKFQLHAIASATVYAILTGFLLPTGIGSSSSTSITKTTVVEEAQSAKIRGVQSITLEYKDTTSVYINPGIVHFWQGTREVWGELKTQITLPVSGLTASTQYAVYASPNNTTVLTLSDIHYSATMPVKLQSKNGYYHPTNADWRCIGFFRSDSSSLILPFFTRNNKYTFTDSNLALVNNYSIGTNQIDFTADAPIGDTYAVIGLWQSANDVYYRMPGTSGVGVTITVLTGQYAEKELAISASKTFSLKSNTTTTIYIKSYGFRYPELIYTGQASGSLSTESNSYSIPIADASLLGHQSGMEVEYVDSTRFRVRNGQIHVGVDATDNIMLMNKNDIIKTVSGLTANTWYAVYVTTPANATHEISDSNIVWSSTMPVEDRVAMGWYHPGNPGWRCLGFFMSDASNNIRAFQFTSNIYSFTDNYILLPNISVTSSQVSNEIGLPVGPSLIYASIGNTVSTDSWNYRLPGNTGAGIMINPGGSWIDAVIQIDKNKIIQVKSNGGDNAFSTKIYRFEVPNGIGPSGSSAVAKYSISVSDPTKIGFKSNTLKVESFDTTSFKVFAGRIHINDDTGNDDIFNISSSITKVASDLTSSSWYAVYAHPGQSGSTLISSTEIEYSLSMPVYDENKLGQYHPSNTGQRCIGYFRTSAASQILGHYIQDRFFQFADTIENAITYPTSLSTAWVDYSYTWVPIENGTVIVSYLSTTAATIYTRPRGSNATGISLATNGDLIQSKIQIANGGVQVKASNSMSFGLQVYGFILPEGI